MLFPPLHAACILFFIILALNASPLEPGQNGTLARRIYGDPSGFSAEATLAPASNRSAKVIQRGNGAWAAADTDREWFIPTKAGTPPQTILVQPDTGAPDFSLMLTLIPVASRGEAPVYNPMKSTTAVKTEGMSWAQGYGDGSVYFTGVVYKDTISVGSLTVVNFEFEVCETSKSQVGGAPYGTLGLNIDPDGMPTKPHRIPSFFPVAMGWLETPVFTVDSHKSTSKGTFDFGHIDRRKYVGDISYASVVADNGGEWVVPISGIVVGTTFVKHDFNVMIDTGNLNGLELPRWALDRYFGQMPGIVWNDYWTTYYFPCDHHLPDLILGVGDSGKVGIPGKVIKIFKADEAANLCRSNLHQGGGWGKEIIELLFVVFDYGNRRVGLAEKSSY